MNIQKRLNLFYRLLNKHFDITVEGLENINPDKNYVFVMNHLSILDVPLAFAVIVPRSNIWVHLFIIDSFYFALYPVTKSIGAMRVSRFQKTKGGKKFNKAQLRKGIRRLKKGRSVLIYPEGSIYGGKTTRILKGGTGAVRMAIESKTEILPMGIKNTNTAYPWLNLSKNPFKTDRKVPITITVGKPISLESFYHLSFDDFSDEKKKILRDITDDIMENLSTLSKVPFVNVPYSK